MQNKSAFWILLPLLLAAFFLVFHNAAAQGSFRDSQISGQPVRARSFSRFGSTFIYGWLYNQYLVIATSEAAFREAMLRL